MHASLQEVYCRVLRNAGLTEEFKHALAGVAGTGTEWALAMTQRSADVESKAKHATEAFLLGQYEKALLGYSEAIPLADENTKVLLIANSVKALMGLGRYEEALQGCNQAFQLKSDHPQVLKCKHELQNVRRYVKETFMKNASGIGGRCDGY